MARNNDARKKQKRTVVDSDVIVDGDSSPSSTTVIVIPSLSFGNILLQFPDLLMQLLPYIADRTVFNSIASCNRDTNEKSKVISPPWPKDYRLPGSSFHSIAAWSPDRTRVAYLCNSGDVITITDTRYGIIHHINPNVGLNFCFLQFSPDGRFLVAASRDCTIRLWDNIAGNYEQIHEWNVIQDDVGRIGQHLSCTCNISACSKYIAVAPYMSNCVVLKNIENGETIRSLTPQPVMQHITKVMFSVDGRAVFVVGLHETSNVIRLWRPYLDDTDKDSLITLWEQKNTLHYTEPIFSHDKTMIVIQDMIYSKGWMLSIDSNYSCTVQELNVQVSDELLDFSSDDECIIYKSNSRLKYWSVGEKKWTGKECMFYKKKARGVHVSSLVQVVQCWPDNRQLIVLDENKKKDNLCMKSIF